MRALPLLLLAALGCADAPAPAADRPGAPAYRVVVDSLVVREPALRYTVRIGAPQIEAAAGEALPAAVEAVNAAVRDSVEALAAAFRPEAPPPGFDTPGEAVDVAGGPEAVFVSHDVLSVLLVVGVATGGAPPTTALLPLTFDLQTGAPVALADLFRPDAPWGDTLAAHVERGVLAQLAARRGAPDARRALYAGGLDPIRRGDVAWTLGPDALHLWVPPYQLAADAASTSEMAVPDAALAPLARPGGRLDRRAAE